MKNEFLKKYQNYILAAVVFAASILIRLGTLGYESINPDAVNWHYRCQQFANGIKYFQFEKTYPHYHPGVSLCHIMFFPTEIYNQITGKVYNTETYLEFNFINSLALVTVISFLISIISLKLGYPLGLVFAVLLNLEPFFFGNSKFIHLDILVSLFVFLALIFYKSFVNTLSKKYLVLVSLLLALGILTKSVAIIFFPVVILGLFLLKKDFIKNLVIFVTFYLLFIFILFPALWVAPIKTVTTIFREADRVGVRTGHSQIFLGNQYSDEEDPGAIFYAGVLLQKTSPLVVFGVIMLIISFIHLLKRRHEVSNYHWVMIISYLLYIGVIFVSNKKLDRYILLLIPPIIYYLSILSLKIRFRYFITPLALINLVSIVYFAPYQFLYFSPLLLNHENSNKLIEQKSFGMGIYALKNHILENYGRVNLGFYDVKPMEAVYPNSLVWDVRQTSPSKVDLLILSSNEVLPEKYSDFKFVESFNLVGIPLYEIYRKN